MKNYYILMADIIDSGHKDGKRLMKEFKKISDKLNEECKESFLSPITITLGDEFQCVVRSLLAGFDIIFAFEEEIVNHDANFKLRYVLNFGEIDTPINSKKAYGMLGDGLTEARDTLEKQKKSKERFIIKIEDPLREETINMAFKLYQYVIDDWKPKDYYLVREFLELGDYKEVAKKLGKDSSLMWRRAESLAIEIYLEAKKLLFLLAEN